MRKIGYSRHFLYGTHLLSLFLNRPGLQAQPLLHLGIKTPKSEHEACLLVESSQVSFGQVGKHLWYSSSGVQGAANIKLFIICLMFLPKYFWAVEINLFLISHCTDFVK